METLAFIVLIVIFAKYFERFLSFLFPSHQLLIQIWGLNKIPKLLLEIARVHKEGVVTWQSLNKAEVKKVQEFYKKLEDVSSVWLTFLYTQNLIYVNTSDKGYFVPTDKYQNQLVHEKIGDIDKDTYVEFIIYRRKGGWFKSPVLIGYLKRSHISIRSEVEDKEIEILFEFPEALINKNFFTKGLESKYKLEKDEIVAPGKNELDDYQDLFYITYDQEHKNGGKFHFQIE